MAATLTAAWNMLRPLSREGVPWSLPLLGLLPALAHPPVGLTPLAWVALGPAMWWLRRGEGGVALWFGAGWGFGLVHAAVQYAWLPDALWRKGGLPFPVFLAFSSAALAVVALYPAVAFALARWAWMRGRVSPYALFPVAYAAQDALLGVTPFGGAPWGSLAATQTHTLGAGGIVPLFGGSGLVLVLAAVGGAGALALEHALARRGQPRAQLKTWAPLLAVALLSAALAWPRPPAPPAVDAEDTVRVLMVPGDHALGTLASPSEAPALVREFAARTFLALSEHARKDGGDEGGPLLALWPESAVPGNAGRGKLLADLFALGGAMDVDVLFGSNAESMGKLYNAAYLVTAERFGTIRYAKRRLVPFGEYVPPGFAALFGKKLTAGARDYSAGEAPPVLAWRGARLGLAICFESILPAHAREAVRAGADVLLVISNDAWLTGAAGRQHLQLSALRALEVGRDLAFVANGGGSAVVRQGRIAEEIPRGGAPRMTLLREREGLTPWARWGEAASGALGAAWLALAWGGPALAGRFRRSRRPAPPWPGGPH